MSATLPFIISGGPGSGKTTLLEALGNEGYDVYPEIPRLLIEEQSKIEGGVLPWQQLGLFADMCFEQMLDQRNKAQLSEQLSFVDRAIPDVCAYLSVGDLPVSETIGSEAANGYQKVVLFCKPTLEIYVQDDVRPYPFEEALSIHESLCDTYQSLGYRVVDVPLMSVAKRVEFVLNQCKNQLTTDVIATQVSKEC
ncbi:predicted ATPase [Vibrio variabilis]|uniref:Predicted ATPase n=1 Tax=Vibrio variabilis TaxID=990271 RepID=A0ABQ0JC95_9VIBR|nr:predicted ATPase [Vibrio variabilis]